MRSPDLVMTRRWSGSTRSSASRRQLAPRSTASRPSLMPRTRLGWKGWAAHIELLTKAMSGASRATWTRSPARTRSASSVSSPATPAPAISTCSLITCSLFARRAQSCRAPLGLGRRLGRRLRRVDDHDRARSVMGALLTDRAEQQADEPAVAARADHEQITFGGGADECFRGCPFDQHAFDLPVLDGQLAYGARQ